MGQVKENIVMSWSGGKDSSLALYKLLKEDKYRVKYLLTTLSADHRRISMHGVREELLEAQARAIGIPLFKVYLEQSASNEEYERKMEEAMNMLKKENINRVAFGDIFLEDLRNYRNKNLAKVGMEAIYPLWKKDTKMLAEEFIELGFKTLICCINDTLPESKFLGSDFNHFFLSNLPHTVDPCGENGEFHSFVYDGPVFQKALKIEMGEKVHRTFDPVDDSGVKSGFWYCDLILS